MLKTLDKYVLRAFFTNYLIAIGVMIGLYVILDLFVNIDEFTQVKSESTWQTAAKIIDYYGYNLFLYFAQLAGVIILVAACFTLGRFHRTNELTAVLASGVSLYRIAAPIILAAVGMNALWAIDQEVIIPRIAPKLARRHSDIEGKNSFAVWFQKDRDALVSAAQFNPHPNVQEMRGVLIIKRDAQNRMTEVIRADRATWDNERRYWDMKKGNGYIMRFGHDSTINASGELGRESIEEYPSSLTPDDLALLQATQWTNFVSMPALDKLQRRNAESGTTEFIKIKHQRMTTPFVNMILLCLGIPFLLNRERVSVIVTGGKCLLLCGVAFVATYLLQNMDLPIGGPTLPAWAPVLIFGPIAAVMMDSIKT